MTATIAVLAKTPVAGKVKTRLCPPFRPHEAARLAAAALADTLETVAAVPQVRRLLVLDGEAGPWVPPGFEVIPQHGGDLGRRLAGAFDATDGPTIVIGMDTPQVTAAALGRALSALALPDTDAILGVADDGGYWAIGLVTPDERVFDGVPMSTNVTGARQFAQLRTLGLRVRSLAPMRDVDDYADAMAVASLAPATRFARELCRIRAVAGAPV